MYIYVLQLVKNKYYIGKTYNPDFTINEHFQYGGHIWTRTYPPLSILEIIENCDDYDVDKYTRKYMDLYGIENVRGGSFDEEILDEYTIKLLEKMSKNTQTNCSICSIVGHFAKKECEKCEKLCDLDKNLVFIQRFIENKKKLELIDPKYEKPPGKIPWSSQQEELLRKEKERAKIQKEKNSEYIPLFDAIYHALNIMKNKQKFAEN
jgi:CRISPR/Cas system-associated protein Cas10 (large subunit of type III CRISPR-Cas system)